MFILSDTNDSLEVLLSSVVATNQSPIYAAYADHTASSFTPGQNNTATNSTTAVTAVSAPAASTQRQVKYLSVYNADTAAITVTVRLNDNATTRIIGKWTLQIGETLEFVDGYGFKVLNTNGAIKQARADVNNDTDDYWFRSRMFGFRMSSPGSVVTTAQLGTGNQYPIFSMGYNEKVRYVNAIVIPQSAAPASGESVDFNLGLFSNVVVSTDYRPSTIISSVAQGTTNIANIAGGVRSYLITFASVVTLPIGYFWWGGLYRVNTATTAGQFETLAITRAVGLKNTEAFGLGRYDVRGNATQAYSASAIDTLYSGLTFVDDGLVTTKAQNINFGLRCVAPSSL